MKFSLFLFLFAFVAQRSLAQHYEYVYKNPKDSTYHCYLGVLPEHTNIKGVIIRDFSALPNKNKKSRYQWMELALENNMAVLYTVSSKYFPELFYNDDGPILLDEMLHEFISKHNIPRNNIFIGGISASGTRALRFAQFCAEGKSKYKHQIKGVFAVDSPLDIERFYKSAERHKKYFSESMQEEAKLVLKAFPEQLGDTPYNQSNTYQKASVFSASAIDGGNAKHYRNSSILLIHEPDIDWWLHKRGASYYDINSYDIVGFAQCLQKMQHEDITLITTSGKGFDRLGNRNCHSWTIVDEAFLIKWIITRTDTN